MKSDLKHLLSALNGMQLPKVLAVLPYRPKEELSSFFDSYSNVPPPKSQFEVTQIQVNVKQRLGKRVNPESSQFSDGLKSFMSSNIEPI